jgi:hypothetical protein
MTAYQHTRSDEMLALLAADRERLLRRYAQVMKRVGGAHPNRSAENARRAELRKRYRQSLRINADKIVQTVCARFTAKTVSLPVTSADVQDIFQPEKSL